MANKKLSKLKREAKKINESTGSVTEEPQAVEGTAPSKGGGPEANKGFESGKNAGLQSKDDHSRHVKQVPRDEGVNSAGTPQEFKVTDNKMSGAGKTQTGGTVKSVTRQEGAGPGRNEVGEGDKQGTDEEVDMANTVPREEGAAAGASEVGNFHDLGGFRSKVREAFGLSLGDKLNSGNDGLNKNDTTGGNVRDGSDASKNV